MKVILIAFTLALSVGCQKTQPAATKNDAAMQDAVMPDAGAAPKSRKYDFSDLKMDDDASSDDLLPDMFIPMAEVGC